MKYLAEFHPFLDPISPRSCNSIRLNDPSLSIYRHPTTLVFISDPRIMVFSLEKPSLLFALFRWEKKNYYPALPTHAPPFIRGNIYFDGYQYGVRCCTKRLHEQQHPCGGSTGDTNTFKHRGITHWKTNL